MVEGRKDACTIDCFLVCPSGKFSVVHGLEIPNSSRGYAMCSSLCSSSATGKPAINPTSISTFLFTLLLHSNTRKENSSQVQHCNHDDQPLRT